MTNNQYPNWFVCVCTFFVYFIFNFSFAGIDFLTGSQYHLTIVGLAVSVALLAVGLLVFLLVQKRRESIEFRRASTGEKVRIARLAEFDDQVLFPLMRTAEYMHYEFVKAYKLAYMDRLGGVSDIQTLAAFNELAPREIQAFRYYEEFGIILVIIQTESLTISENFVPKNAFEVDEDGSFAEFKIDGVCVAIYEKSTGTLCLNGANLQTTNIYRHQSLKYFKSSWPQ